MTGSSAVGRHFCPALDEVALYDRLERGLLRLHGRKDVSAADKELLLDVVNRVAWDDAIHIAAPWDDRVTLCGNWDRNRISLDGERPGGLEGCWTCLMAAEWFDKTKGTS